MENASDALIMAGQILIFIIALTVCISSFTTVRAEVNRIVGENEEIRLAKDGDTYINYIESKKSNSIRVVGEETLVSSMYRAIKENYVIYIKTSADVSSIGDVIKTMEATKNIPDDDSEKTGSIIAVGDKLIKITIGTDEFTNQNVNKILQSGLFEKIRDKKFNEYVGEYQNATNEGVTSENKEVYRVITYVEVSQTSS